MADVVLVAVLVVAYLSVFGACIASFVRDPAAAALGEAETESAKTIPFLRAPRVPETRSAGAAPAPLSRSVLRTPRQRSDGMMYPTVKPRQERRSLSAVS